MSVNNKSISIIIEDNNYVGSLNKKELKIFNQFREDINFKIFKENKRLNNLINKVKKYKNIYSCQYNILNDEIKVKKIKRNKVCILDLDYYIYDVDDITVYIISKNKEKAIKKFNKKMIIVKDMIDDIDDISQDKINFHLNKIKK